jgi:hypothetical protein
MLFTSVCKEYDEIPSLKLRYFQIIRGLRNIYHDDLDSVLINHVNIDINDPKSTICNKRKYKILLNFYKKHQLKWNLYLEKNRRNQYVSIDSECRD